ncbi:MAG TPA: DinB family protein [Candidatus Dormibacteraeota bacterium]
MDEDGARLVAGTVAALYRSVHDGLREQVRGLDHGTLNWRPLPKANSIAVLVTHTLGSERELMRAVRGISTERDRESEFRAEAEAADLLAMLDQADQDLDEHLGAVTVADLTEMRQRGERPPRAGLDWLISNYGHAREHLAQIELTKQLYDSRT